MPNIFIPPVYPVIHGLLDYMPENTRYGGVFLFRVFIYTPVDEVYGLHVKL